VLFGKLRTITDITDITLTHSQKHPVFIAQLALVFISLDSVNSVVPCTASMYDSTQL